MRKCMRGRCRDIGDGSTYLTKGKIYELTRGLSTEIVTIDKCDDGMKHSFYKNRFQMLSDKIGNKERIAKRMEELNV